MCNLWMQCTLGSAAGGRESPAMASTPRTLVVDPCFAAMAGMKLPLGLKPLKLGFLSSRQCCAMATRSGVKAGGYDVEGISIAGHETCVIVPSMKVAFDIGRCPQRAVSQDFLLISHSHLDHIGGIPMYLATRGLYSMKPPTVIVPAPIKGRVEKLLEVYSELNHAELLVNLVGLDIGQEYELGRNHIVKPFKTYHGIPSQGYLVYAVKKKLKPEYIGLPGSKIKELKVTHGVEIDYVVRSPEIAFTGDTTADFITDENNADVLRAKLLIMEATFLDDETSIEHARDCGHVHLSEVKELSHKFQNSAILFIHFSARYQEKDITTALEHLPEELRDRVQPLLHGFV